MQNEHFAFNIASEFDLPFYIEGSGQGQDAYAKAVCMALVAFMPPEGLEELVETLKELYQFYSFTPERVLPLPHVVDVAMLPSSSG